MSKKPTLTIGIPAHNEAANIVNLLQTLIAQSLKMYQLKRIIVICDGCTDNTEELVEAVAKKHPIIKVVGGEKRTGKAAALNKIYTLATTDLLLTLDADTLPQNNSFIDTLVKGLTENPQARVAGPRHVPVKTNTLMGKFAEYSYLSLEDAFLQINNGNNFYSMMCGALMKKKLYTSFTYPKGTLSDQCYLFAKATEDNSDGFVLVSEAHLLFRTVTTFADWRLLSTRSVVGDKADVVHHFGEEILSRYSMPKQLYATSLIKWFFKNPLYLTGAVIMNILIRVFPYTKSLPSNGQWEATASSKQAINI